MSEVQIAIIDQEDTQITLAVPGVQGPAGAISSGGSTNQVFYKVSNTNYDAGWTFIGNANVDAAAAIAGTKISPNFGSQTIATTGVFSHALGAAATPSLTFTGDLNTGIYSPGADQVAVATNGTQRLTVDTAATTSTLPVVHPLGAVGTPSLTFTGDLNTGIFSPGADQVAISTNGTRRLIILSDGTLGLGAASVLKQGSGVDGGSATGTLELYNGGTGNTTLENTGAFPILFKTNGNERLRITSTGALNFVGAGTAGSTQAVSFNGSAPVDSMVLTSGGLLGIGTSDPRGIIHVGADLHSGATDAAAINLKQTSTTAATGIYLERSAERKGYYIYLGGNEDSLNFQRNNNGTKADVMTLTRDGLVGIGTTTPQEVLDVNGRGRFQGSSSSAVSGAGLELAYVSASTKGQILSYNRSTSTYLETNIIGNPLTFNIGGSEAAKIDSSGRLLVGTTSARTLLSQSMGIQIETTDYPACGLSIVNNQNADANPLLLIGKSRGATLNSNTIVLAGDTLGEIQFLGADGSAMRSAARIACLVDGTPGASDMPGRLVFSTTADGESSPTPRMTIDSAGRLLVSTSSTSHGGGGGIQCSSVNATSHALIVNQIEPTAGTTYKLISGYRGVFGVSAAETFIVYNNGNVQNTNNSYLGISDVKLKENIVDASSQWNDIKDLQVRNYNFKEGQTHTQIGLVAQEVELVSPGLVSESPDRDEKGNDLGTVTKSVNYSVLYMKAVKALQEAMERIETLEARLTAAGID